VNYSQIVPIFLLIVLTIVGYFSILKKQKRLIAKHLFAAEYLNKFNEFSAQILQQEKLNEKSFIWLTKNVDKMQEMLGIIGIVQYRPAFERHIVGDYQILINTLTQITNRMAHEDDIRTCISILLRFVGILENRVSEINKNLRNPFVWFSEGVRLAITSPLYLLYSFGLLGSSTAEKLSESPLARLISGIIALVGFLASIVQILQGWDDIIKLLKSLN